MEQPDNKNNTGKKILVVEDESSLLNAIALKLSNVGFTVLKATDGVKALDLALANHPNIILLDIGMPKMDGLTMLHKLREDAWGKVASVIMLTNFEADDEKLSHILADQPSYYLVKSDNSLEQVLVKIQELLASQETEVQSILNSQMGEENNKKKEGELI